MQIRSTVVVLSVVAVAAAAPALAGSGFTGNVCGLVPAKQVAMVAGATKKCANAKPLPGLGSKIYTGNWVGATAKSASLQVTVAVYSDAGALQLAKRNLEQGLPGPPKKIAGLGAPAYGATGAMGAGIHVAVGKDVVYLSVSTIGTTPKSPTVLEPLARALVKRLA
jgi:nitrous oxidase accessory protein NosD